MRDFLDLWIVAKCDEGKRSDDDTVMQGHQHTAHGDNGH